MWLTLFDVYFLNVYIYIYTYGVLLFDVMTLQVGGFFSVVGSGI